MYVLIVSAFVALWTPSGTYSPFHLIQLLTVYFAEGRAAVATKKLAARAFAMSNDRTRRVWDSDFCVFSVVGSHLSGGCDFYLFCSDGSV